MNGTAERQRCCTTPSVTLRRSSGFPTESAKRIAERRMCLGSQGCGSPTVLSLRLRLFMRRTSTMTRVFYNALAGAAQHEKGGAEAPPSRPIKPVLLAAYVHDREDAGPELHRHVAAGVLDGVPHLVGRYADPRDGVLRVVLLGQPDDLAARVVVVRELPGHGLHPHVGQPVTVEDHPG